MVISSELRTPDSFDEDLQPLQILSVNSGHFARHSVMAEAVRPVGRDLHVQHPVAAGLRQRLDVQTDHCQVGFELTGLSGKIHEFFKPVE